VDGASVGAVTTYTFNNVTAVHTISASFAINTFTITASSGPNGSISSAGTVTVNYGATPTYTFTANPGYQVGAITVDGVNAGFGNSYTFAPVMANHTITVSFTNITFTITPTAGTGGTITPSVQVLVPSGGSQKFDIAPNTGYHIVDVQADSVSLGALTSYTFTNVTANHTISATFAINTFAINFVSGGNGTLTGTTSQTVSYGGSATAVTAVPSTGYQFVNWTGTGGFVTTTTNPLTVTNVTAAQTITANFAISTFAINFVSGGNGTLTGTTSQTVSYGGSATAVTAVPSTGYHFVNWTGTGGFVTTTTNPLTVTNVTAAQTITANFSNQYTLAVTLVGPGSVTSNPAGINCGNNCSALYAVGTPVDLTATPNGSHVFSGWSGDCTGLTNPTQVLMNGDIACTANFN
jgi:uncharacterized repeat protein (TIGR02543 family)